jgi:hypothetical protein
LLHSKANATFENIRYAKYDRVGNLGLIGDKFRTIEAKTGKIEGFGSIKE